MESARASALVNRFSIAAGSSFSGDLAMSETYTPEIIDIKDWNKIIAETETESDRAAAIVLGTLLELTIERCILHRLLPMTIDEHSNLFKAGQAPLNNFAAKINLGRTLGLYGPVTKATIDTIKSIRNRFAHFFHMSFEHDQISGLCKKLPTFADPVGLPPLPGISGLRLEMRTKYRNAAWNFIQKIPRETRLIVPPPNPRDLL